MLRSIIVALVASLVSCGGAALAQDKPPANPPKHAPKPAEQKPAEAKPPAAPKPPASPEDAALRAALKTLAKGLADGNAEQIRHVIHADNPTERKMVDAMADMAVQIAQLYKASAKAFGEEQAKALTGDVAAEMGRIDRADVAIDGDNATVLYKPEATASKDPADAGTVEASPPMQLKKIEGRWQVPVSSLSKDTTPEEIEQRLSDLEAQSKVIADLTAEVTAGKYKSADKAAEAWQAKVMQALTPPRKPAPDGKGEPEKPPKDGPGAGAKKAG